MADPRDLAVRWLGTVLAGYVDGDVDRLAAAILDQPGVEVGEATMADSVMRYPIPPMPPNSRRAILWLPVEPVAEEQR